MEIYLDAIMGIGTKKDEVRKNKDYHKKTYFNEIGRFDNLGYVFKAIDSYYEISNNESWNNYKITNS